MCRSKENNILKDHIVVLKIRDSVRESLQLLGFRHNACDLQQTELFQHTHLVNKNIDDAEEEFVRGVKLIPK